MPPHERDRNSGGFPGIFVRFPPYARARVRTAPPRTAAAAEPKQPKSRCDTRIATFPSYITKPSYGISPVGVMVGIMHKSGREPTRKLSNYDDTACAMKRS